MPLEDGFYNWTYDDDNDHDDDVDDDDDWSERLMQVDLPAEIWVDTSESFLLLHRFYSLN